MDGNFRGLESSSYKIWSTRVGLGSMPSWPVLMRTQSNGLAFQSPLRHEDTPGQPIPTKVSSVSLPVLKARCTRVDKRRQHQPADLGKGVYPGLEWLPTLPRVGGRGLHASDLSPVLGGCTQYGLI